MELLLIDAERFGIQTVGASQDMRGRKTGLTEALRAIRQGYANALLVQDTDSFGDCPHAARRAIKQIQNSGALLIYSCAAVTKSKG